MSFGHVIRMDDHRLPKQLIIVYLCTVNSDRESETEGDKLVLPFRPPKIPRFVYQNPSVVIVFLFHTKFDSKEKKDIYIKLCMQFKSSSFIDKIDKIDKNRLISGRKVVRIDFHRFIDPIDIDQHDFIE